MNSASVRIGLASGIGSVIRTAHTLGVQSDIPDNPAMLLGALGIPPIEMADAYSTIARIGSRLPLRTIRFVNDDHGNQVSTNDVVQPVQVFPARDMYILADVMKGVIDRGTAANARSMGFKLIAAGKTGTTNDKRDAWFIGFTPKTLALTWIGFDDNAPIGLSGGEGAVPIWTKFMNAETAGQPNADFAMPGGISLVSVDESSGGLSMPMCPKNVVVQEAFKDGTQPTNVCPLHSPQAPPPPTLDQFGTPVALDTTGTVTTETAAAPMTSAAPPPAAPPPTQTQPVKSETREPERLPSAPPPSTNTSAPQTSTTGSLPPTTTSTNPP
jgi:membrane carboxypeptidase/penicillin-binding protein